MGILTDKAVRELTAPDKGNKILYDDRNDGVKGFGIRITAAGARSFVFRYIDQDGRERRATIGPYPGLSVVAARARAKKLMEEGTDPLGERERRRQAEEAAKANTFKIAVEDYYQREKVGRKPIATADEVKRVLLRDFADWVDKPLDQIADTDIQKRLEEICFGDPKARPPVKPRPYLANRAHAYLGGFFRWCARPGIKRLPVSPMIGLPKPFTDEKARNRVFDEAEIKALWKAADGLGEVRGAYLKLAILTGKRRSALARMRWSEIDDAWTWTPPAETRSKGRNKRVHVTPLPRLAQRILTRLRPRQGDPDASDYVFVGRLRGTHLDAGTTFQRAVQEASKIPDFFLHACRHTVETEMGGTLKVLPHIRDLVLDHAPLRGSGKDYDHNEYKKEIGEALEQWAQHVESLVAPKGVGLLG